VLTTEANGRATDNLEKALEIGMANARRDEYRRRQRHPADPVDVGELDERVAAPGALDPHEFAERREAVRVLFHETRGALTERQLAVLMLRDVLNWSPREVCRELGISHRLYREERPRALRVAQAELAARLAPDSQPALEAA
jgi:DNA-directed RNA polymerase specialized sigma24 family protein